MDYFYESINTCNGSNLKNILRNVTKAYHFQGLNLYFIIFLICMPSSIQSSYEFHSAKTFNEFQKTL